MRAVALEVGPDPVFRRGDSIFHSECHIRDHVQEHGHVQRRHRHVYRPAVSPVDCKAAVEPVRGYPPHQEVVDSVHADAHSGDIRPDSLLPAASFRRGHGGREHTCPSVCRYAGDILDYRVRIGHTRHRRRRILHDSPGPEAAVILRGDKEHFLQVRIHFRARGPGGDSGPAGDPLCRCAEGLDCDPRAVRPAFRSRGHLPYFHASESGGAECR